MSLHHSEGADRKPYNPVSMLKAQILKYLRRVPSDRRLALLKWNRRVAGACGFKQKTPSHGLFPQFKHRLGRDGYEKVFSLIIKHLLKRGIIRGEVVAVDSTAIKAYSQRDLGNRGGKSDFDARVNGWIEDTNWAHYDMAHAIMLTESLTRLEVQEELYECYRRFYGSWRRRLTGISSKNSLKRRVSRHFKRAGVVHQLRTLF